MAEHSQVTPSSADGTPYSSTNPMPTSSAPAVAAATATHSNVTAAITSTQLLAASASRKGFELYNHSLTEKLYVGIGVAAVVGQGLCIWPGGYYSNWASPQAVNGIWTAADGSKAGVVSYA